MLKIGDFSRLSRVSIRMLRYYDDAGLIKPEKIDTSTGYRYYSEAQLPIMWQINELKNMGFGVSAMAEFMKAGHDTALMERLLAIHREELCDQVKDLEGKMQLLDVALERLRKDKFMNYACIYKELPSRNVASVRQVIPTYADEGMLFGIMLKEMGEHNITPCGFSCDIMHDKEYKDSNVDVEVQITINGTYPDTEHVRFFSTEPVQVASITFNGSYNQFDAVYKEMAEWTNKNGYEFCGPLMDIYHVGPHDTSDDANYVTEVCCPIRRK